MTWSTVHDEEGLIRQDLVISGTDHSKSHLMNSFLVVHIQDSTSTTLEGYPCSAPAVVMGCWDLHIKLGLIIFQALSSPWHLFQKRPALSVLNTLLGQLNTPFFSYLLEHDGMHSCCFLICFGHCFQGVCLGLTINLSN